jgi:mycofactocin precursor
MRFCSKDFIGFSSQGTSGGVMDKEPKLPAADARVKEATAEEPGILEEIVIEELGVDGICGVY